MYICMCALQGYSPALFFVLWSIWNIHGFKSFIISGNRKPVGTMSEHRNQSWWLQRAVLLTSLSGTHQRVLLQVSHISQLASHRVLANKSTSDLLCSPLEFGDETFPEVWKSRKTFLLFSLKLYLATAPLLSLFHCVRSGKGFSASLTSIV